jgi:hypothetical protein
MASRPSGGRVEPEVRLGLTKRMLSGASYLDMMTLIRVASSTIYDVLHRTIARTIRRIAVPGLPIQQNELRNLALSFTNSRQLPKPLFWLRGSTRRDLYMRYRIHWTCTDPENFTAVRVCTLFLLKLLPMLNTGFSTSPLNVPGVYLTGLPRLHKPLAFDCVRKHFPQEFGQLAMPLTRAEMESSLRGSLDSCLRMNSAYQEIHLISATVLCECALNRRL